MAYFTASCDTVEKNTAFAKSLELDYPILSDPTGDVASAYGIFNDARKLSSRVTFIIGQDGKLLAIESKVNAANHGKDLVKKLAELGVEKSK